MFEFGVEVGAVVAVEVFVGVGELVLVGVGGSDVAAFVLVAVGGSGVDDFVLVGVGYAVFVAVGVSVFRRLASAEKSILCAINGI